MQKCQKVVKIFFVKCVLGACWSCARVSTAEKNSSDPVGHFIPFFLTFFGVGVLVVCRFCAWNFVCHDGGHLCVKKGGRKR